jgi:hypothetical protein
VGVGNLGRKIEGLRRVWRDWRLTLLMAATLVMLVGMSMIALVDGIFVKEQVRQLRNDDGWLLVSSELQSWRDLGRMITLRIGPVLMGRNLCDKYGMQE